MQLKLVNQRPAMQRKMRSPQLAFNLRFKPWQMQPFMIHPVLPGETLKNALFMSRCVSDPLKDKLMGWWYETYVFYVKHTDLDISNDLKEMHLNPAKVMTTFNAAANLQQFHAGNGINYVQRCLDAVRRWYFRDELETEPTAIAGLPPAKINHEGWWNSMKLASAMPINDHELPGDNPVVPDNAPPGFTVHYAQWEAMRAANLTIATYEDYLKSFGVSVPAEQDEEEQRPELIRYKKEFTYPTNTVEPTTGVPSSAAVWSVSERADKDRYFREPGFLFGVVVCRPKVLLSTIIGTMTSFMNDAYAWLPAIVQDLPFTALREFAPTAGPAPQLYGQNYWVDVRDLLMYGEQFRNHDLVGQGNAVALPSITAGLKYGTEAMADGFFSGLAANRFLRADGIVTLDIASSVHTDMST